MKKILLFLTGALIISARASGPAFAKKGGELGNAFVPFESRIVGIALEVPRRWSLTDLSQSVAFRDPNAAENFLAVGRDEAGPRSLPELRARIAERNPGSAWEEVRFAGLDGFSGLVNGVRVIHLLRAEGDLLSLRFRGADQGSGETQLRHMLATFRVEPPVD